MANTSNNSLSNSLKGKIWLATAALAFFICIFGMISYLLFSFLFSNTFYAIFIPFLISTLTVCAFGWWISSEIVGSIERVTLLSRSLERGIGSVLPKTSGATETDELMRTMFRLSQQNHKLVNLMDQVSQGNLNVVFTSQDSSDRTSMTFQKLLAKVSESIHAKQELEKLQNSVRQLSAETKAVKDNNFNVVVESDLEETKELTNTINYLVERLSDLIGQIKESSTTSQQSTVELQRNLHSLVRQDEARIQEMNRASITLKQVPQTVQKIAEELAQSVSSATHSIEKAHSGTKVAHANLNAVNQLRKLIQESIKRIQKLNESSQEIGKVAKTVEDLAKRTSMIALNASIQAAELNEHGHGFVAVSEEVERLSKRANETNKSISSLNKYLQAEINQVESSLEITVSEAANLSKYALESSNSIGEMERYVRQFLNLQEKISSYTNENTEETEKAYQTFVAGISHTEQNILVLKDANENLRLLNSSINSLQESVEEYEILIESASEPASEDNTPVLPQLGDSFEDLPVQN